MSWSIEFTGTKAGAVKRVVEQFDKMAAGYSAKEEGKDILAAKDRILALIEAMDLGADTYTDWNAVIVKASGSHSTGANGLLSASMQISVMRTSVALDPVPETPASAVLGGCAGG